MKKKVLSIVLSIAMVCSFTACGNEADKSSGSTNTSVKEAVTEKAKEIMTVEITVPAYVFTMGQEDGESTQASIDSLTEEARNAGVKEITQNEDGSVTMRMTEAAQESLLNEMKTSIDSGISDTLADKENYPSISNITYNEDMTVFDFTVARGFENGFEQFIVYAYFIYGNYYQIFAGVPGDQLKTTVNYIDESTGEVYFTTDTTQLTDSNQSAAGDSK